MRARGTARRRIGVAFAVGTAAVAIPFVAATPAHAAETISSEGSVTVESFPSTRQVTVDQFDDDGGLLELTEVTVTATVEGELEGSVENLSATREKTLNGMFEASITVNGVGVENLQAAGSDATSWTLAPGEIQPIGMAGSDASEVTITDAETLDDFVGSGTMDYEVFSEVTVDIDGPAPYKTTGVAGGEATVRVDYTYNDVCADDPYDPRCVEEPECETSTLLIDPLAEGPYALPGGGTFTVVDLYDTPDGPVIDWSSTAPVEFITVHTASVLTTVTESVGGLLSGTGLHAGLDVETNLWDTPTRLTVCAGSAPTEPDCVKATDKIDPVTEGDHPLSGGGTLTILDKEDLGGGETFDWTSDVPIYWISVKGGPRAIEPELFEYPGGATSGEDLHAPFNPHSGKWYGLSHLKLCAAEADDEPTCEEQPDRDGCEPTSREDDSRTAQQPPAEQAEEEQPPVKVDPAPAPQQDESESEPEPEPEPDPAPEPEVTEPAATEPDPAPAPETTPEPAAGDVPAGEE